MKFGENLQSIRKEHKLSQEQLAEKLYVSRQAVSKWESGQSYPEMDKIITMCKIFNCSIDELVNEDNLDLKGIGKKNKYNIRNYLDELLSFVTKTIQMIMSMSFKEIIRCGVELFIIAMILLIFQIPVDYIGSIGNKLFSLLPIFDNFLIQLWTFILNLSYFILVIIIFIHIFKTRYLDTYEEDLTGEEEVITDSEELIKEEEITKEEKVVQVKKVKEKRSMTFALSSLVASMVSILIKALTIAITIPFLMSLMMFTIFLVISIILLFKGVIYFGVFIALASALVFNVILLETLFNIIFNRKSNLNKIFVVLLGTIIGLGIGIGITTFDVANSKYLNSLPDDYPLSTKVDEIKMNKKFILSDMYNVELVADESLKDTIKIEFKYYENYITVGYNIVSENYLDFYQENANKILFPELSNLMINNLKEKTFYNYNLLSEYKVKIYSSTANIEQIKNNTQKYYDDRAEEERNNQAQYNYYQIQIDEKNTRIDELESQIESKNSEIEEYQSKIQEYKDTINSIIQE
ncbi:MAG: helix-turn-helix domain-containing protein [Bacilli bacterium]|nr:helix-turn-helix domain-containing protein [Bacilli bacterium]MDD4808547.1 helix-turn-helix domain-containing protein [Bacilli bacterium]